MSKFSLLLGFDAALLSVVLWSFTWGVTEDAQGTVGIVVCTLFGFSYYILFLFPLILCFFKNRSFCPLLFSGVWFFSMSNLNEIVESCSFSTVFVSKQLLP